MIKLFFGLLLTLALSGIYGYIFTNWLNQIIWAPFWRRGIWMMVFIYTVLLAFFLMIYGGYRIGVLRVGNLIYSQTLALFFANFITYFQITVQDKKFTTPLPIITNFVLSLIASAILTYLLSKVYSAIFPPRRLLLAYGERKDFNLMEKMSIRDDKYVIAKTMYYPDFIDDMETQVSLYDAIIVGDIPSHERNLIIKYCFSQWSAYLQRTEAFGYTYEKL